MGKSRIVSGSKYAQAPTEQLQLRGPIKVAIVHAQGAFAGDNIEARIHFPERPWDRTRSTGSCAAWPTGRRGRGRVPRRHPGGATYTSDLIHHQVAKVESKKPLVVSMGDVAASSGCMISYPCSMIVANPMTRTGSIGSIFTVPYVKGLTNKLGLTLPTA